VDRPGALAVLNRRILEAYSRRTIDTLRAALPLRIALPHLEPVIRRAGATLAAARPPDREAMSGLLEATQDIDRAFLAQVGSLPIRIVVPYREVAPVRMRRIERLFAAAHRILDAWRMGRGLRAAVQESYPRAELERLLGDLLRLYAQETRVLSGSVQLPLPLVQLRERIAQSLYEIMGDVARRLAGELSLAVFRKNPSRRAP
jgi:hypothetical protein